MSLVLIEYYKPEIAVIHLNQPEHLNAMSLEMAEEFKNLVKTLKNNNKLKVIILTGSGQAFSAGGDLEMLKSKTKIAQLRNKELMLEFYNSFLCILDLKKPVIAAINGSAVGAGLCLACACDFRIAVSQAKLGLTFLKLGLHPGMGATAFIPKIIGYSKAAEILYTANIITSEQAYALGLLNKLVVNSEELTRETLKLAEELSAVGSSALSQLIETMRVGTEELKKALEREAVCQSINYSGLEFQEGIQAAIEKRKPNF